MPPVELLLSALDSLLGSKVRALLTMLGVVIGVLSIILLVSVGEGLREYLARSFAGMGANLVQVTPGRRDAKGLSTAPIATTRRLSREDEVAVLRRVQAVDAVCGIVNGGATVKNGARRRDTAVAGVGAPFLRIRGTEIELGRFFTAEEVEAHRRYAVLGRTVAQELFGQESPLGRSLRIAEGEFHVLGTLVRRGTSLGFDLDDQVFIPTTAAMDLFAQDGLSSILLRARDRQSVGPAIDEVTELLRRRHSGQLDFTVISQDDLLATVDAVMATLSGVLLAIASIALLVGGIGIANIMLVSVQERTREIGVRRSVGARRRDILWQFLIEALVISLLGGALGLLLGAALILTARLLLPGLPLQVSPTTVAVALGFSALTGILAGIAPARRGAYMDPVTALRQE